jgi:hypothetical protein
MHPKQRCAGPLGDGGCIRVHTQFTQGHLYCRFLEVDPFSEYVAITHIANIVFAPVAVMIALGWACRFALWFCSTVLRLLADIKRVIPMTVCTY